MRFAEILGQERPKLYLRRAVCSGKLATAYLFTGIPGVGKTSTARALAAYLGCRARKEDDSCGHCASCRSLRDGNHPDFLMLKPEGQNLKIDQIREVEAQMAFPPLRATHRVVFVDRAETMTPEAANCFLRTLEEPPEANLLILSAVEPLNLLPTIVSRCQRVSFEPLPEEAVARWLEEQRGLEPAEARVLAAVSGGSLGRALHMVETGFMERRRRWLKGLWEIGSASPEEAINKAYQWSLEHREERAGAPVGPEGIVSDMFHVWETWYRDLMVIHAGGPEELLINTDVREALAQAGRVSSGEGPAQGVLAINRAREELLRQGNPALVLEHMALRLRRLGGQLQGRA